MMCPIVEWKTSVGSYRLWHVTLARVRPTSSMIKPQVRLAMVPVIAMAQSEAMKTAAWGTSDRSMKIDSCPPRSASYILTETVF
jgi:hypothetical protein